LKQTAAKKLKLSVVGIIKTIEHDVPIIDKSFGFETAVEVSILEKRIRNEILFRKQQELSNQLLLRRQDLRMQLDW